ncbi:BMP family lipoprotein [Microbispora sp. ATCC PTA-5024]|uniref:BMP family lipoprotein n=1 Tax=Microbispora sp. ATCC PTA-5024 TaxID=316330 RepID=UPI0003DB9197|nr:BMP family ABC transporter substrate-binding protein [Microbispora sp. ATCC PTA-5024]ETK33306.1 ABC transporter substrate-binding protein [Microbispora sp. ATCC PTA-5024]
MRSIAVLMTGAVLAAATACGGVHSPGATVPGDHPRALRIGLAYDIGGRGDKSFNDAAADGLDDARRSLGLLQVQEVAAQPGEPESAKVNRLRLMAKAGYSPIIAVGYAYSDAVKDVAPKFPGTKFAIVDDSVASGPNVTNLLFAEEQGSFLVGAAAAMKSKTGDVGFVGGVESPLIKKFEAGYTQGVKYVNPRAKIEIAYLTKPPDLTGFDNAAKAQDAAQKMFAAGADVVYQAAGASGAGVFKAAQSAKGWAIGVDSDQARTADPSVRGLILTSMVKRVDVAVYDYIANLMDGTVKSGRAVYDLKLGGVDYSTTGGHIDDIQPRLEQLKQEIIIGKIRVSAG